MKRHLFMAVALATALCSCQNIDLSDDMKKNEETGQYEQTKAFTFHVKGDFTTSYDEMGTRAAVRLEENNTAGITDIWVLDYDSNGRLLQSVHQSSTQTGITFGSVPMNLTYGHHDIKFIASKGDIPSLTSSAISWAKVKDTFTLDYPVDVAANSNGNRAPELKRVVSGVKVVMTDAVPANAKEVIVTMNRSLSLALPTLVATDATESTNAFELPSSWVGNAGGELSTYTLCPSDEMTTDVNILVLDENGNSISSFTIENVELKKNRMTILTGECFGRGSGFSLSVDNTWDEPLNMSF